MLVAVTGGTGFVGSHTTAMLVRAGHTVRLLVRDLAKMERTFAAHGLVVDDFVVGDVTDPAVINELLEGCDAVFHAAAIVALEASRASEVRRTNQLSVETVLSAAQRLSIERIVYVSSAGALFTPGGPPISGDSPIGRTTSAYGESKATAERFVRDLQREGLPILTVYPTGVMGPDDPGLTDPNRALQILFDWVAPLTTSGYQPVDVRDLAALNVALFESKQRSGRYVAAGKYYPWRELYNKIDSLTGLALRRVAAPGTLLRWLGAGADVVKRLKPFSLPITRESMMFATRWQIADAAATERDLGIRFRNIDESLTDTLRWLVRAGHLRSEQIGRLGEGR